MGKHEVTYKTVTIAILAMFFFLRGYSQEGQEDSARLLSPEKEVKTHSVVDSLLAEGFSLDTLRLKEITDSVSEVVSDEISVIDYQDSLTIRVPMVKDSLMGYLSPQMKTRFIPDPKKSLWYAIIFPGGGQIYNRKYWKLPLIYGGFLGCIYAMNWNNTMYRDYSQAYIDIMDSDENTKSYENFIPAHYDIEANKTRLQDMFRRKKNYYRRFRDLSMFCMIGVYALSILDAYIDAELSSFDISRDLTLKVYPAVMNEKHSTMRAQGMSTSSYGVQCSLNF